MSEQGFSLAKEWFKDSVKEKYSHNFKWMGTSIIQYPQDMVAMQEIIYELKPDLIIETGIAHGGSIVFYASLLELNAMAEGPTYVRIAKGEGVPNADGQKSSNIDNKIVITYGSGAKAGVEYAESNKINFIVMEELGMGSFTILDKSCSTFREIIVVEDHFSNTGMYSYVTQWSNSRNLEIQVKSICPKSYSLNVGFEFKDFQLSFEP